MSKKKGVLLRHEEIGCAVVHFEFSFKVSERRLVFE